MRIYIKKVFIFLIIFLNFITTAFANDYSTHWAGRIIQKWIDGGKVDGVGTLENFEPDRAITRAEFVKIIINNLGISQEDEAEIKFDDVKKDAWYYPYVACAVQNEIVNGISETLFDPEASLSRQDAAVILGRAYKIENTSSFRMFKYRDGLDISDYALGYMGYMCEHNIMKGYTDNTIRPLAHITRAEALVLADRMQNKNTEENEKIQFTKGYPRLKDSGLSQGFNILIKTNKPCTIYYAIVDASKNTAVPSNINSFLINIGEADMDTSVYIAADTKKTYNIFFKAVDWYGNESAIKSIYGARTLFYDKGDGTEKNPYIITTEEQLNAMRFFLDKHFKLQNDIVLSSNWTPIGSADSQNEMFRGSLDGGGYKISNLSVAVKGDHAGLFGYIYAGTVKNLYVSADRVTGRNCVGIIAGESNGGKIENCFTDGLVNASENNAGAIVGLNNGSVERCQSAALTVQASAYSGGIAGINSGKIEECMSCSYSVLSNMYSSAIAGANVGGTIKNCLAANMNVTDYMTSNNGRITTNKSGGITKNNYAYNKMNSTSGDSLPDADSQNGLDVEWEKFKDKDFYTGILHWDFSSHWVLADEEDSFLLPSLKNLSKPLIREGVTIYAPKRISSVKELQAIEAAPENHYILTCDIELPSGGENGNWKMICADKSLLDTPENGFSGSLDGNGHTISNLDIEYDADKKMYGMFGVIAGGTVKNLTIKDASISGSETTGIIAAINYGTVSGCSVSGFIRTDQTDVAPMTGAVVGLNYGTIQNTDSTYIISANGNSTTTGGICADNEGVIINCSAKGEITIKGRNGGSSSSCGGIAGFNGEGYIYSVYAKSTISVKTHTAYSGGIVGMLNGGEIYQACSSGNIKIASETLAESVSYAGGIAGLSGYGAILHCFSFMSVDAAANKAYAGGISGYNLSGHIQNTYAANSIRQKGVEEGFIGGIAAVNEEGFISENVAINTNLSTNGLGGRICAKTAGGAVSNNYALDTITINNKIPADSDINGIGVPFSEIKNSDFYFKPVSEGGKLGWSSVRYDGENGAWKWGVNVNPYYCLPLLNNVKGQDTFNMPIY
ncbi:MAG: S-layer homology domain-containing protein [Clostridia bacterium]|nr:S-layer homology domain-containing protein [Clostridia bacterium]